MFISHSKKDSVIVSAVRSAFSGLKIEPYFVEDQPAGVPPTKEIVDVLRGAEALFVFLTTSSLAGDTRDWIVFELGAAFAHNIPIFPWKQNAIAKEQLPRLLEQVGKYRDLDIQSSQGGIELVGDIRNIAQTIEHTSPQEQVEVKRATEKTYYDARIRGMLEGVFGPIRYLEDNFTEQSAIQLAETVRIRRNGILGLDPTTSKVAPNISKGLIELIQLVEKHTPTYPFAAPVQMDFDSATAFLRDPKTEPLIATLRKQIEQRLSPE